MSKFFHGGWVTLLLAAHLFPAFSFAAPDDDFLAARDAYAARNSIKLEQFAPRLSQHVLAPFVQYWQLSLKIEHAGIGEVRDFLLRHADSHVSDRLRGEWLKALGKKQQWDIFLAEVTPLVITDTELNCYHLQARLSISPEEPHTLAEARRVWFSGNDLPKSCDPVFAFLASKALLSINDVFARMRLALEAGNVSVARHIAQYLPSEHQDNLKPMEIIAENPARYLDKNATDLSQRSVREMVLFAIHRIARTDPNHAIQRWETLKNQFSPPEQAYIAGQFGYQLARRHDARANTWFAAAQDNMLSELQLAWKARAAIRTQQWPTLLNTIAAMPETMQHEAEWRYWKARAIKATGQPVASDELFAQLSREYNYYGQLSGEELGAVIGPVTITYKPSEDEIKAMAERTNLQRALALYALNMRSEGAREWLWAIRGFDDKQLLAAAELAKRNELYDRAISTADRTKQLHDFSLRFPAPYREAMQTHTQATGLDDAWVYGLIRQESRFIQVARSSAGASGFMQLMPATAKWVARKMGMKNYSPNLVNQLDTNFALGTYYLRHVLDSLSGSPVLATAAYNAGPGRARRWQDTQPMDPTAYIESIPFSETRDYVKKVMSNAAYYAARFNEPLLSLKKRLGIIPGRSSKEESNNDEP